MHKHHGRCPACNGVKPLSRHHIKPIRHFGKGRHNDHIVLLCRGCHDDLEVIITRRERYRAGELATWEYFAIVAKFIKERST